MKSRIKIYLLLTLLGILSFPATSQIDYKWSNAVLGGSGATTFFYSHPKVQDLHFIATDVGTPYRWNASIGKWEEMMIFNIPVEYYTWEYHQRCGEIAFDPNDATGNILYATVAAGKGTIAGGGNQAKGTVLKSTDRGHTWVDLNLPMYLDPNDPTNKRYGTSIIVDPNNSNVVWVVSDQDGTYRSTNGGTSWTKMTTGIPDRGATRGGTPEKFESPTRFIHIDKTNGTITDGSGIVCSKVIYLGAVDGVYKSNDGGATFSKITESPTHNIRFTAANDGVMYITSQPASNQAYLYRFDGTSFSNVSPEGGAIGYAQPAVNPNNSKEVVITATGHWGTDAAYRTQNNGIPGSWVKLVNTFDKTQSPHAQTPQTVNGVTFNAFAYVWDQFNPTKVWTVDMSDVKTCDNIWASTTHWVIKNKGLELVMVLGPLVAPTSGRNELLASTADVGGESWTDVSKNAETIAGTALEYQIYSGFNSQSVDYQENDPNFIVRVVTDGWANNGREDALPGYSTDGGLTWTRFNNAKIPGTRGRIMVTNNNRIFWYTQNDFPAGTNNASAMGNLYYSDDRGENWTKSNVPSGVYRMGSQWNINPGQNHMAIDKVNPNKIYLLNTNTTGGMDAELWRSDNGGTSFAKVSTTPIPSHTRSWDGSAYSTFCNLVVNPSKEGEIWFGSYHQYSSAGLYRSTDGGVTFTQINTIIPRYIAGCMSDGPNPHFILFALTAQYGTLDKYCLYRSDDNAATWQKVSSPAPGLVQSIAAGKGGRVYVGVAGNGIYYGDANANVQSVDITLPDASVVIGHTIQLAYEISPAFATNKNVTWTSDNASVATVDANGIVTGVALGTANITITTEDGGKTDVITITVTPEVMPEDIQIPSVIYLNPNGAKSLDAVVLPTNTTDKTLIYSTDSPLLTVSENGTITAGAKRGTGTVTITTANGGISKTVQIIINNIVSAINAGTENDNNIPGKTLTIGQFIPEGPSGGLWAQYSNPGYFTNTINLSNAQNPAPMEVYQSVRNQLVNAYFLRYFFKGLIPYGTYTVRLHFMDPYSTAANQNIFNVYQLDDNGKKITTQDSITGLDIYSLAGGNFKAYTRTLSVKATSKGNVNVSFAGTKGRAMISGLELLVTEVSDFQLNPGADAVAVGESAQINFTISPADATNQYVTWTSSDPSILTVNSSGTVTGVSPGTATITGVTLDNGLTVTKQITVLAVAVTGVAVSPSNTSMNVNSTLQLAANIVPANATNKNVSWSSSDETIATVDANGKVTALKRGNVVITATTLDGGKTGTSSIAVNNIPITDLTLSSGLATIGVGSTLQVTGTLTPANATPNTLTWASSDVSVATVDNTGLVTAVGVGTSTISATTQDEVIITKTLNVEVVAMGTCGEVQNNGFESDLVNWEIIEGDSNVKISTTTVAHGLRALELSSAETKTTVSTKNPITVNAAENISIAAKYRIETGTGGVFPFWAGGIFTFYDANNNKLGEIKKNATTISGVTAGYIEQVFSLAAPANSAKVHIAFSKEGPGKLFVDDVCFTINTGLWGIYSNPFGLSVTPNPVKNVANVTLNLNENTNMVIKIFNTLGACVLEEMQSCNVGTNQFQINVSHLKAGLYVVEAQKQGSVEKSSIKIIK